MGPWVDELDRTWQSVAAALGSKKLVVDLCGVTQVALDGRRVLADLHKGTGAEFLADTPMTKYFAAEARRKKRDGNKEA